MSSPRAAAKVAGKPARRPAAVAKLKARGLESPYLKAFVLARINPTRLPFLIWELPLTGDEPTPAPPPVDAPLVKSA